MSWRRESRSPHQPEQQPSMSWPGLVPGHLRLTTRRADSHARFGEARRAHDKEAFAQIIPPRERYAAYVEGEKDFERCVRAARCGNRRSEAAWDQITAAGADRADESERSCALDAGCLERERAGEFA